jgi:TPR repeat protein
MIAAAMAVAQSRPATPTTSAAPPGTPGRIAEITDLVIEPTPDAVRIIVHLDSGVEYRSERARDPHRILFDLQGTWATQRFNGRKMLVGVGPVSRVRIAQHGPTTARLVLDTSEEVRYWVSLLLNPPRLEVVVPIKPAEKTQALRVPERKSANGTAAAEITASLPKERAKFSAPLVPAKPAEIPRPRALDVPRPERVRPQPRSSALPGEPPRDPAAAAKWYLQLAERGNAEAQFRLANSYVQGTGVRRDSAAAAKWYGRAAALGHQAAQNNLGVLHANGWGAAKSDKQALRWFRSAAGAGNADAQSNLGAMYLLGRGVPRDETEAAQWLNKAAERGDREAQYSLGTLYANGRGVRADDAEAVKWFRKAAEQSYAPAQLALGKMYVAGRGQPPDYKQALALFRQAAGQRLPEAAYQIGSLYQQGRGVPKSDTEAMTWFRKAAESGSTDAQYHLAELYRDGKMVPQDYVSAYVWFALAAASGNEPATTALNSIAPKMTMGQIADAQQRALALGARNQSKNPAAFVSSAQ